MKPVALTRRVTLVGSGLLGFSLTDPHDSHVYLVDGGSEAVLIDAGCGLAAGPIAANARAVLGGRPVSAILLTHAHADHAAGASALAADLGATVYALPEAAAAVSAGDEDASGLTAARAAGRYPPAVTMAPVPVSPVPPSLRAGEVRIEAIETPGHAAGHACYLLRADGEPTVLFSGDLVFARGRIALLATPDADIGALARSMFDLAATAFDVMMPGHGEPVLTGAAAHLAQAIACLRRQELPPELPR